MEINTLRKLALTGMKIMRGRIVNINSLGEILVETDPDCLSLPCDFLRTTSAPLPKLSPGELVLYAIDEKRSHGYVLGIIDRYKTDGHISSDNAIHINPEQEFREIKFNAAEKIELSCGKTSLTMRKDGEVVIKGTQLTSRASGINKIKGAAVRIN